MLREPPTVGHAACDTGNHARSLRADEGNAMKGQQKPKKLGKKAPLKSLKEKRAAKKAAAKHGTFDA